MVEVEISWVINRFKHFEYVHNTAEVHIKIIIILNGLWPASIQYEDGFIIEIIMDLFDRNVPMLPGHLIHSLYVLIILMCTSAALWMYSKCLNLGITLEITRVICIPTNEIKKYISQFIMII